MATPRPARLPSADRTAPDGMYASVEAGAGTTGLDDPAMRRLKFTCAAWGVQPITQDDNADQASQSPSVVGNAG
jgi:hypothetical protein